MDQNDYQSRETRTLVINYEQIRDDLQPRKLAIANKY